ncbi:hypothetical protein ACFLYX_03790, partial [Chloroflexota bacterium]
MKRIVFPARILGRLMVAFVLTLALLPLSSIPAAALSPSDYFTFSYNIQFNQSQVTGSQPFTA